MNGFLNTESNHCNSSNEEILLAQIRECFGRVAYSHKTHEKQTDILICKDSFWKTIQIILSVIISGTLLSTFTELFGYGKYWVLIGAILSVLLAIINLHLKNLNYGIVAKQHKEIAVQLWNIRERYFSLIVDLISKSVDIEIATKEREVLQDKLADIYINAPRTNSKAYKMAQKALKFNEDLTFSAKEIDMLLPEKLRLSNGGKKNDNIRDVQ